MRSDAQHVYDAAVVGLGNIGFLFDLDTKRKNIWSHAKAYTACGHTRLAAAVEIDPQKRALFAKHYPGVPAYDSLDDMFARHSVEIVSLATPVETHLPLFRSLTRYPVKAIFCEKPLTAISTEGREMTALAERAGIILAVNHIRRWEKSFLSATRCVREGGIGRVHAVNAVYPGQIFNVGSHLFDVLRLILGCDPDQVLGWFIGNDADDPSVSGILHFSQVPCMISALARRENLIFELDVIGENGRLKVLENGLKIEHFVFRDSPRYSGYRELFPLEVPQQTSSERFVEAITDLALVLDGAKDKVNCSGIDGYWAVHIAEEMLSSARAGGKARPLFGPKSNSLPL